MDKSAEINSKALLQRQVLQWRRQLLLRRGLYALSAGLLLFFLLLLWLPIWQAAAGGLLLGMGVWLLHRWQQPVSHINTLYLAHWLDRHYPALQHSSSLLLANPQQLSVPARLQRRQVVERLGGVMANMQPPVSLKTPLGILLGVLLGGILLVKVWQPSMNAPGSYLDAGIPTAIDSAQAQAVEILRQLPKLDEARLQVSPPAYTGRSGKQYPLSDVQAPEGSRITWQLRFKGGIEQVFLTNQQNDTLHFRETSRGAWTAQLIAAKPVFYRIGYATTTDTLFSPFLKIEVQPDEAPRVRIVSPDQYMLDQDGSRFSVQVEASDDYGLEDVYLSLTMSRGSGEGVSFRDEKLWIEAAKGTKKIQKQLSISPQALGMQPGDELYYRLEAHDNKPPRGQQRRSNTWFYQWKDTAEAASMLSSGLALDVEPEYFRSQRQIIIDTEKLIKTQKSRQVEEWESASQNLAVDQKLLRLRYGKFLGEEFESGIIPMPDQHEDEEHEDGEEEHDDETEYNNDRHQHDVEGHEEPAGAAPAQGLLEMFGHAHDTEEGATFYEESVKVKLKAALSEMWEAEKYLRLSQPRQALPYEYRALKIIKEVQQSTRIYVERVGLELPTLIPQEHRLKGKQAAIQPAARVQRQLHADTLVATRHLVARMSHWERGVALQAKDYQLLRQSSKEVANLLVQGGPFMSYFYLLNSLTTLLEEPIPPAAVIKKAQQGLYQLIPRQQAANAKQQTLSPLQKKFLEKATLQP